MTNDVKGETEQQILASLPEPEVFVLAVAATIRNVYIQCRRAIEVSEGRAPIYSPGVKWDGKGQDPVKNKGNAWVKIAWAVLRNKLNPTVFVRSQFSFNTGSAGLPLMPNQLVSPQALARYGAFSPPATVGDVQLNLSAASNQLNLQAYNYHGRPDWPVDRIRRRVLSDPRSDVPSLLLYMAAVEQNMMDIAATHRLDAMLEYWRDADAYDVVCGADLPDCFKRLSRQYLDEVLACEFDIGDELN